jgi:serine protease Do
MTISVRIFTFAIALLAANSLSAFQAAPPRFDFQPFAFAGGAPGGSFLGVAVAEIDNERARALRLGEVHGVEITNIEGDSPAAKAGLKTGDAVLDYNGQRVEGIEQFQRLVRETPSGREVRLTISRNGATQGLTATVGVRKAPKAFHSEDFFKGVEMPDMSSLRDLPQVFASWSSSFLGIEAESLGSQLAAYFGVKEGVLVRSVTKDSAADKAGIKAGDVITKIDQTKVATPGEISAAIRSVRPKKTFPVEFVRDRHESSVSVTVAEDHSEGMVMPRVRVMGH